MNNQPGYPYQQPLPASTSGWAIFSLIAGLLAWMGVFGLGGIAAVIAGYIARGQIRESGGRLGGDGLATAGLVLGYLNLAFALLGICLFIMMFAGIIGTPLLCAPFFNSVNTY